MPQSPNGDLCHLLNARLLEVAKHPNVTVWTNTRVNRAEARARPGAFRSSCASILVTWT